MTQVDIRLAGVCVALRKIFPPITEFKVTIVGDGSSIHALQKALAVARTPELLDSVVEVSIGKNKIPDDNP